MNHTTIEQSKLLVQLGLDPDSCDLKFSHGQVVARDVMDEGCFFPIFHDEYPCWSLEALAILAGTSLSFNKSQYTVPQLQQYEFDRCFSLVINQLS